MVPLASLATSLVKILINRVRPDSRYIQIWAHEIDPSFPSGHVVFYTVFFGFLIAIMTKNKMIPRIVRMVVVTISAILIILIGFSRLYLGAHWISDVIGGYAFGGILLMILLYFYDKPELK